MNTYTIDFETGAIVKGSSKSPVPVGVAVKVNNQPGIYFAWGHPTKNNSSFEYVKTLLSEIWQDNDALILCHNTKFDLRITLEYFDLDPVDINFGDTLFLAFLNDPRDASLGLKPLSNKYLYMPPEEQQELNLWLIDNVAGANEGNCGMFISQAPGDLAGKYAVGDVDRTYALNNFFLDKFSDDEKLMAAYRRELDLMPVILEMEMNGVRLSDNIDAEQKKWQDKFDAGEEYLQSIVGNTSLGGKLMFNKLNELGYLDLTNAEKTAKGNIRYGREFLPKLVKDDKLRGVLTMRSKLSKVLGTYLNPWLESYKKFGRFYPYFNQTRNDDDRGTRTGRLSSNLQQIPADIGDEDVPNLRKMICPDKDEVLLKRDFSAQEIRVTAHYAEGSIMKAFNEDPKLDVHDFVRDLIHAKTGNMLTRRIVKNLSFLKLYGGGAKLLSEMLNCTLPEAVSFFASYDKALPEFKQLSRDIEAQVRRGTLLRTWGGRLYDVEMSGRGALYYKLMNVLIQGSSADQTKEAMIRYFYHPYRSGRIVLQVHDEIVVSCPEEHVENEMNLLKWAMEKMEDWDVPMVSDSKIGPNFGELKEYENE